MSFICGLPYVLRAGASPKMQAIAAPILQGVRYEDRPIYFSDVIVQRDNPAESFAALRGCTWAYNEPESQSGYGITRYELVKRGLTDGFFGKVMQAGFHQKAIRWVAGGKIDAAAIDSQVLDIELRDFPELADQIKVIEVLGPSTIQPMTVAAHMPKNLKRDIQHILTEIHEFPDARPHLDKGLIARFVPISDADYDDIREMLRACQDADFLTLR
jgi:phosphonate transport system substrate-binding protein